MKRFILPLLLFCLLTAWKNNDYKTEVTVVTIEVNQKFDGDTFAFSYPKDWSVTEQEALAGGVFYLSVEKNGLDSSGLFTITSFEGEYYLDETIEENISEYKANSFLKKFKSSDIKEGKFNNINVRYSSFTFNVAGLKHQGVIYVFYTKGKTYSIIKQEALEDKKKNANGFKTIEESFSAK